jgi:hypothetical protein
MFPCLRRGLLTVVAAGSFSGLYGRSNDSLAVDGLMDLVRQRYRERRAAVPAFKMRVYSKALLEKYESGSYHPKSLLLRHLDVYWKNPDERRTLETARRYLHDFTMVEQSSAAFLYLDMPEYDVPDDWSSPIKFHLCSIASPLASDAASNYVFEGIEPSLADSFPAVRIRVTPRHSVTPSVEGEIAIDPRTMDIRSMNLRFTDAAKHYPFARHLRVRVNLQGGDDYPLPSETEWEFEIEFPWYGRMRYAVHSRVYGTEMHPSIPRGLFARDLRTRTADALFRDEQFWRDHDALPLDAREQSALERLARLPHNRSVLEPDIEAFLNRQNGTDVHLGFGALPDIRYNRVEGVFLGAEVEFKELSLRRTVRDVTLKTKYGYGLEDKRSKYWLEASKGLGGRLSIGGRYYRALDRVESQLAGSVLVNSLTALAYRYDQFHYYYIRGYELFLSVQPRYDLSFTGTYIHRRDRSAERNTTYAFIKGIFDPEPVLPINDGRLRGLMVTGRYKMGHGHGIHSRETYYVLSSQLLHANDDWLRSDFDFSRLHSTLRFHWPSTQRGSLDGTAYVGYSTGRVPRQYLFDLYGGTTPYVLRTLSLLEANESHIQGNYLAALTVEHNFGGAILERTGLPWLRRGEIDLIPSFSIGYADASARTKAGLSYPIRTVKEPILEAAIGIGDIYRYFRLDFAWRLNHGNIGKQHFAVTLMTLLQDY